MSYVVLVKSKVEISQNFVALSEYMNFIVQERGTFKISNDVLDLSLNEKFLFFFRNSWSHLLKSTGKVMAKFMTQWVSVKLQIVSGNFFTYITKRFKTFEIEAHIALIEKVDYFFHQTFRMAENSCQKVPIIRHL